MLNEVEDDAESEEGLVAPSVVAAEPEVFSEPLLESPALDPDLALPLLA